LFGPGGAAELPGMAEGFKYISPREFQKLSAADKERYLTALFEVLHGTRKPLQETVAATPAPKRRAARATKS